ncbi:MAG: hypothetical protein VB075_11265 [Petrimonas sp.]|nr:hypothetical protein [Petrimonas sp.]MEA5045131.1 hypothetical protein [Petrimonas sp.]
MKRDDERNEGLAVIQRCGVNGTERRMLLARSMRAQQYERVE